MPDEELPELPSSDLTLIPVGTNPGEEEEEADPEVEPQPVVRWTNGAGQFVEGGAVAASTTDGTGTRTFLPLRPVTVKRGKL